jgi:hypothetical protein
MQSLGGVVGVQRAQLACCTLQRTMTALLPASCT